MTLENIFGVAATILASLGGAGVIILGLSNWLGKVWANRLMEADRANHARALEDVRATYAKEIEGLKSALQDELELRKWPRLREDAIIQDLRTDFRELTVKTASALHSMCWLTWAAREGAEHLKQEQINSYNREMHELFPHITGRLASIAAIDREIFDCLDDVIKDLIDLDWKIGKAALRYIEGQAETARELAECHGAASELEENLPLRIVEVVTNRIEVRAKQIAELPRYALHDGAPLTKASSSAPKHEEAQ